MAQTAPACVRPGSAQAPHVSVDAVLAAAVRAAAVRAPEPVTAAGAAAALARDAAVRVPTATTAAEEPRSLVLSLRTQFPSRRRGSWARRAGRRHPSGRHDVCTVSTIDLP